MAKKRSYFYDPFQAGDADSSVADNPVTRYLKNRSSATETSFADTLKNQQVQQEQKQKSSDTRSNLQKLKDVGKDLAKSTVSSYDRIGKGVGEAIGFGSKESEASRAAQDSLVEQNNKIIADYGTRLKDPQLDPKKRQQYQATIAQAVKQNEETYKQATDTNKTVMERTDPVKGAAAVGSIGFDLATLGTVSGTGKAAANAVVRKQLEKTIGKEILEFGGKQIAKKVASGAAQGAVSGALGAVGEKGGDTTAADVAKGAARGAATGGAITFGAAGLGKLFQMGPGKYLEQVKKTKAYKAAFKAEQAAQPKSLPAGETRKLLPAGDTTKALPQGKLRSESRSTIPISEEEYQKRFDGLSKSFDKETEGVKDLPPLQQKIVLDDIHNRHLAELEKLDDEFTNGKSSDSGFVMGEDKKTPKKESSPIALAETMYGQVQQRVDQIDEIIGDVQQRGTTKRTAEELRDLMRERRQAQDVLDGKVRFDDLYGAPQAADPLDPNAPSGVRQPAELTMDAAVDTPTLESEAISGGAGSRKKEILDSPITNDQSGGIREKGVRAAFNRVFNPVRNFSDETRQAFKRNAGGRFVANFKAKQVATELKKTAKLADVELDFDLARAIEDGTAPDNELTRQFREIADKTRQEAVDAGLDIGYRENYVPHIWKQDVTEVDTIARRAGLTARAEGERVIPTYAEGIELGLKPKYDSPADMMADYVRNLQTTQTTVALLTDLRAQGLVGAGKLQDGWSFITAEGFPRTQGGAPLSAPKQVAKVLNNLYGKSDSTIDKFLAGAAKLNSKWQDIALAGGVPQTPANFFTFSQMAKETALGAGQLITGSPIQGAKTIYSPVAAFLRSFSGKETTRFAEANSGLLEAMAKRGVPISFEQSSKKGLSWDKLFNEPTFGRFMPNLQLNTARNVQNALQKKLGREAALDVTAETIRKLYGISDQLLTGREKAVQDAVGALTFAPKYRESILNVLGHTVKSLDPRTYRDRSYALNRRLAVGIGLTYLVYDQLNRATTGHGMDKNPEGKELTIAIPYGDRDADGNQKVVYIPFMPSFMTLPRAAYNAITATARGDLKSAGAEGGKMLSMPIQVGAQIATNRDYFGNPIYVDAEASKLKRKEVDSPLNIAKKVGLYAAGQSTPGAVRAGLQYAQGKSPEQVGATATEAPVRFGELSGKSTNKESYSPGQVTNDFFKAYDPLKSKRYTVSSEVTDLVKQGRVNEAKRKAEEYNQQVAERFKKYYDKYGSNPTDEATWDDMLNSLLISTSNRAFSARVKQ